VGPRGRSSDAKNWRVSPGQNLRRRARRSPDWTATGPWSDDPKGDQHRQVLGKGRVCTAWTNHRHTETSERAALAATVEAYRRCQERTQDATRRVRMAVEAIAR